LADESLVSCPGKVTMCILALADDMTGALEIGAKFSAAGIETIVSARPVSIGCAPVVVLDTETRHVDAETAGSEIQRFVAASGTLRPHLVYKKTDSTLRGNIAAELRALADIYPDWRTGYAPAYPALGRTVTAGVLYVHGRPVSETEFARDELNPIGDSSIVAMLNYHPSCTVFDGDTDAHLAEAARTILSSTVMRIAAGPAGLAEWIAATIDLPRRPVQPCPAIQTCLVLNGSRNQLSKRQIRCFTRPGWKVVSHSHEPGLHPADVASANGRHLLAQTVFHSPDAVFVIGGDTAFGFLRELGFPPMTPIAEVVSGVPVTRLAAADLQQAIPGRRSDLFLITKAGGFGDEDVLTRVHAKLSDRHAC